MPQNFPNRRLRLLRSFHSAVQSANPAATLGAYLPPPPAHGEIVVLGAGKAAAAMARAAEAFYPPEIPLRGVVVAPHGAENGAGLSRIKMLTGAHPLPDSAGANAARILMREARSCKKTDLALAFISGGGSSLLGAPAGRLAFADVREIMRRLLHSGADVREMNVVRRHLFVAAGGKLAAACRAPLLALIMSDVVGDNPADIASGPCAFSPSAAADALAVLHKWRVPFSPAVESFLRSEKAALPSAAALAHTENIVFANAAGALSAAEKTLRRGGIRTILNLGEISGTAKAAAQLHRGRLADLQKLPATQLPAAIISGGETTAAGGAKLSELSAGGKQSRGARLSAETKSRGGRNTEFALHLWRITPPEIVALSADTDGADGTTGAAGAMFGAEERNRATAAGLSPTAHLQRGDSGGFFAAINALVRTGATGVNISDYRAILFGYEN